MHLQIGVKKAVRKNVSIYAHELDQNTALSPSFHSKTDGRYLHSVIFSKAVFDRDRDKQRKEHMGMWENMARRLSFSSGFISFS